MTVIVELTKGYQAIVDDEDRDFSEISWYALVVDSGVYAGRKQWTGTKGKDAMRLLHVEIMKKVDPAGFHQGMEVDHIDHNPLNNRRENLRWATKSQNMANRGPQQNNTSGYKGVTWDKRRSKWKAQIKLNKVMHNIGRFDSKEEAHEAYARKARELFGEFAPPQSEMISDDLDHARKVCKATGWPAVSL